MATLGPPGQHLSFAQIEDAWTRNGGNPVMAPVMAAIAVAESGGLSNNLNDNSRTGDYSVGLWQVNYFGPLRPGRSTSYGTPEQLAADVDRQARAAISISGNGQNLTPWTTYTSGAYKGPLRAAGGSLPAIPAIAGVVAPAAPQGAQVADNEGYLIDLTMPSAIPNIRVSRAVARKIVGVTVVVAGGVVGLAGVFVLTGRSVPLPGAAGLVKGAVGAGRQAGVERRAKRAERSIADTTPDELAERRRNRAADRRGREAEEQMRRTAEEPF